jgi:hypothetical protein
MVTRVHEAICVAAQNKLWNIRCWDLQVYGLVSMLFFFGCI